MEIRTAARVNKTSLVGPLVESRGCRTPGNLDIAPRHGAVMVGFSNTIGQIPGIVGVAVTGWLIDVTGTYSAAFVLATAVSALGALVFGCLFNARLFVD
jgi:MFS family permease